MPTARAEAGGPSRWPVVVIVLLAVGVAGVIFLLPGLSEPRSGPEPAAPTVSRSEESPRQGSASAQRLQRERAKQDLSQVVQQLDGTRAALQARGVQVWSPDSFAFADGQLVEARAQLDEGRLEAARSALEAAAGSLAEIEASADGKWKESLDETRSALEGRSPTAAERSLETALAMDSEHETVRELKRRVDVMSALLVKTDAAVLAGREGRHEAAVRNWKAATSIDTSSKRARRGLAEAEAALAEARFQALLSRVRNGLASGELDEATTALDAARDLRPKSEQVPPLMRELAAAREDERVGTLVVEGLRLEGQERWDEALRRHESALALRPQLEAALVGRARCLSWLDLSRRLDAHIARPDRFIAAEVEAEARSLLAEAGSREGGGAHHAARMQQLRELLNKAVAPRSVVLRSDGMTVVTLQRVGELGQFRERTLELLPGSYTLTGRRAGYRDVRLKLTVKGDEDPAPTLVACVEGLSTR